MYLCYFKQNDKAFVKTEYFSEEFLRVEFQFTGLLFFKFWFLIQAIFTAQFWRSLTELDWYQVFLLEIAIWFFCLISVGTFIRAYFWKVEVLRKPLTFTEKFQKTFLKHPFLLPGVLSNKTNKSITWGKKTSASRSFSREIFADSHLRLKFNIFQVSSTLPMLRPPFYWWQFHLSQVTFCAEFSFWFNLLENKFNKRHGKFYFA